MKTEYFHPMEAGEIITRSSRLFLRNLSGLVVITLLPQAALLAVELALERAELAPPNNLLVVLAATVLVNAIALSALVTAVSGAVLGGMPTVAQTYSLTFRNGPHRVVAAYLLTGLASSIGFLMFILPGLWFGSLLTLTIPVIVIEGKSPMEAIHRSVAMMRKHIIKGMFVFGFVIMVSGFAPLLVQLILGVGPFTPVLAALVGAVTLPLAYAANVVLYLSIRSGEGYTAVLLEEDLTERLQK